MKLFTIFISPTIQYFTESFYLRAEFLVIALVQQLPVMLQLLHPLHLPLAALQLALHLLHLLP